MYMCNYENEIRFTKRKES